MQILYVEPESNYIVHVMFLCEIGDFENDLKSWYVSVNVSNQTFRIILQTYQDFGLFAKKRNMHNCTCIHIFNILSTYHTHHSYTAGGRRPVIHRGTNIYSMHNFTHTYRCRICNAIQ